MKNTNSKNVPIVGNAPMVKKVPILKNIVFFEKLLNCKSKKIFLNYFYFWLNTFEHNTLQGICKSMIELMTSF